MAVRNEERVLAASLAHLREQQVSVYVLDHGSSDASRRIAERFRGRGVVEIEDLPYGGEFDHQSILRRKEALAAELDADWIVHLDADEFRVASQPRRTVADALREAGEAGYNAVNFLEFTFIPTREEPDHDHPAFLQTMRHYYAFLPAFPHRMNAFKRQDGPVDLHTRYGHRVSFPGLRLAPRSLYMRHYLYLSADHALEKYGGQRWPADEVAKGLHAWRTGLRREHLSHPSRDELRRYRTDHALDPSNPRRRHHIADAVLGMAERS